MDEEINPTSLRQAAIVVAIIIGIGIIWHQWSIKRPSSLILPGGITYVGPTPTPPTPTPGLSQGKIPIDPSGTWTTREGKIHPYTLDVPSSLNLGEFPGDPYDSITVFYPETEANNNIFFRVEDLNKLKKSAFIGKPKEYANNWWKDYIWTGVETLTEFTTKNGLTGYRAVFQTNTKEPAYEHVFLVVPKRADLIIWMSQKLFTKEIFDRMVDSVSWSP